MNVFMNSCVIYVVNLSLLLAFFPKSTVEFDCQKNTTNLTHSCAPPDANSLPQTSASLSHTTPEGLQFSGSFIVEKRSLVAIYSVTGRAEDGLVGSSLLTDLG